MSARKERNNCEPRAGYASAWWLGRWRSPTYNDLGKPQKRSSTSGPVSGRTNDGGILFAASLSGIKDMICLRIQFSFPNKLFLNII